MAYETGNTTGNADLVAKLATFAQSNGWTYGACSGGHYVLSKNGVYAVVAYDASNIYLMGATGYASGSAWNAQPGNSGMTSTTNFMSGTHKAYHFFAGDTYMYVVVEVTTNIFRHFNFGLLTKYGTYTGGQFVNGTRWGTLRYYGNYGNDSFCNYPDHNYHGGPFDALAYESYGVNNHVRADIDGNSNKYWRIRRADDGNSQARGTVRNGDVSLMDSLSDRSVNTFNQRTILLPIYVDVTRGSGLYSLVGQAPDCRSINMANYNPGQIITIGSDQWVIFPIVQKTNTWDDQYSYVQSSGNYALAYKKVV